MTRTKQKPAKKAAKQPLATALQFDGDRVIPLLGAAIDDDRVVAMLHDLGRTKPPDTNEHEIEFKRVGVALVFEGKRDGKPALSQVQFELRRRWTGFSKYLGRLPYGISSDLATSDRETVLADRGALGASGDENWYSYHFADHEIAMGFGKTVIETVFVIATPPAT